MQHKLISLPVKTPINKTQSWLELANLYREIAPLHLKEIFQTDPGRVKRMTKRLGDDFTIDFSKNRVTDKVMNTLIKLAREAKLEQWTEKMFSGEKINITEDRAVLHVALRNVGYENGKFYPLSEIKVDGENIMDDIVKVLNRMSQFTDKVRNGEWKGYTGKPVKKVISLGIGGSDLGPKMGTKALTPYSGDIDVTYVSNVDGADISEALKNADPETTLFVIESKTFTTQETMTNAQTAKNWFLENGGSQEDIKKHFVAASIAAEKVAEFGIDTDNMFPFWDWVGGRYSMSSAIGLPMMIAIGKENFAAFLEGLHEMDMHFKNTDFEDNIPVLMGLTGIWYNNFFNAETKAILPYDHYMADFVKYLQQGDMESNGKGVNRYGKSLEIQSGPVIWGEPGTNGQHSFYQLIHQGTKLIPADFIAFAKSHNPVGDHHAKLLSNVFAQAEALMSGKTPEQLREEGCPEELIPFRTFKGNRPSTTILAEKLTPKTLGRLIAMYEHVIFTQGIIMQVLSFDQWGVELGKQLAKAILPEIQDRQVDEEAHDKSTSNLLNEYLRMTEEN